MRIFVVSLFIAFSIAVVLDSCYTSTEKNENSEKTEMVPAKFVGSSACESCHANEYSDWKKSDHFLAMQHANDSTVLGNFNDAVYTADGVTNRFFKKENKFYINTQGDDGKNHDYEILFTFGYFPLQQYLVSFPGGKMQSTRAAWDSRNKKWFHQYAGQKIFHHDWLHWTANSQNWNTMCASCHSTNLQKNYDFTTDTYHTTYDEINVSCESCHGPGSNHVSYVKSNEYGKSGGIKNSGFIYAADTMNQLQANACAPCHARKSDISQTMIHSDELLDDLIPQTINNEFYFADGQISHEDYEYGSFTQSKMFHNNVRCSSCHNPHSGKLKKIGNDLCMSCHKPRYNTEEHHFHSANTESAQCVNCHMPAKTFMGNDIRRDHSFRIPRPDQSVVYNTPNACTGCHKEKTAKWAADAINKWYGTTRAYHFSDDLLPGSMLDEKSEAHLHKLLKDKNQPEIARATAAGYLGNIQTQNSADALLNAISDEKALVRYHSLRSLENFDPNFWRQHALSSLSDKVRAVRIAAADLYHNISPDEIPESERAAFNSADSENRNFLNYQTDFSIGNVMLADYELKGKKYHDAIVHYLRGLKKDSLMNYARLNLSATYNSVGKNSEALKTLYDASKIDPGNNRIYYNLGLLCYEMGDINPALENFQKSERLGFREPGLFYNYGLLLQMQKKFGEAEKIFQKGIALYPQALNINYAIAYFYVERKQPQKAKSHAEYLRKVDPNNPQYMDLFKILGL